MKIPSIQRDVKSSRKSGEAFDIGRVQKMSHARSRGKRSSSHHATAAAKGKKSHTSRHDARRMPISTLLIYTSLVLAVVILAAAFWIYPHLRRERSGAAAPLLVEIPAAESPSITEDHALAKVEKALSIRDPAVIAEYFHLGEATAPDVITFLTSTEQTAGPVDACRWVSSSESSGILIECVLVTYQKQDAHHARHALLTPDEYGVWKIDFASFARTMQPTWEDLLSGRAENARARVHIQPDTYFNGIYADDKQWASYSISSRDCDSVMTGYCLIGSAQALALEKINSGSGSVSRVYVELRKRPGTEKRQFEITRVLAGDWIMGPVPYDELMR